MKEKQLSILFIGIAIIINFITAKYFGHLKDINLFYMGSDYFDFLAYVVGGILGYVIILIGISAFISFFIILFKKDRSKFIYYFAILFLMLSLFVFYMFFQNMLFEKSLSIIY